LFLGILKCGWQRARSTPSVIHFVALAPILM
jgi:hypothetical protein